MCSIVGSAANSATYHHLTRRSRSIVGRRHVYVYIHMYVHIYTYIFMNLCMCVYIHMQYCWERCQFRNPSSSHAPTQIRCRGALRVLIETQAEKNSLTNSWNSLRQYVHILQHTATHATHCNTE